MTDHSLDPALPWQPRRWAALAVLCLVALMTSVAVTVVIVAIPPIQHSFDINAYQAAWVVDAYAIPFGTLLLVGSRLGDLVGRRRMLLLGLVLFMAASVACAEASTGLMLSAARFLQGVGGALASSVVLGLVRDLFPDPGERRRAVAAYVGVSGAASALGLLVGGALTAVDWRAVFWINMPVGLVTLLCALPLVPKLPGVPGSRLHLPSALALVLGLMAAVYAMITAGESGSAVWRPAPTFVVLFLGTLGARAWRHTRKRRVPLRLLGSRSATGASLVLFLLAVGVYAFFYFIPMSLQHIHGYGPLRAGLAFVPAALLMAVMPWAVPGLLRRFGRLPLILSGLVAVGLGIHLGSFLHFGWSYKMYVLPPLLLLGYGVGVLVPVLTDLVLTSAAPDEPGAAFGLAAMAPQVGGALGLAALAPFAANATRSLRTLNLPGWNLSARTALSAGYGNALWMGAMTVFATFVVALFMLQPEPERDPATVTTP